MDPTYNVVPRSVWLTGSQCTAGSDGSRIRTFHWLNIQGSIAHIFHTVHRASLARNSKRSEAFRKETKHALARLAFLHEHVRRASCEVRWHRGSQRPSRSQVPMRGGGPSARTSTPLAPDQLVPAPPHDVMSCGEWPTRRHFVPTSWSRPRGVLVWESPAFPAAGWRRLPMLDLRAIGRKWLVKAVVFSSAAAATGSGGVQRRR